MNPSLNNNQFMDDSKEKEEISQSISNNNEQKETKVDLDAVNTNSEEELSPVDKEYKECLEEFKNIMEYKCSPEERIHTVINISNGVAFYEVVLYNEQTQSSKTLDRRSFDYSDSNKRNIEEKLFTPMSKVYAEKNPIIADEFEPVGNLEANTSFINDKKSSLTFKGLTKTYASSLHEEVIKYNKRYFSGERENVKDEELNVQTSPALNSDPYEDTKTNLFQEIDINEMNQENSIDDELREYGNLSQDETEALKQEMGYTRKLVKKDNPNSGKMSRTLIYILLSIIILLLIFITYKLLK